MPRYELTVNGRSRDVEAAADMPLVWVLRDRLGPTGTKFGCGVGVCAPPVPCVAPAVVSAVFAATGRRIRRLPIRPADLV